MFSLFLLIALLMPTKGVARETIRVVTDAWPPYVFEENGSITGFDYEVTQVVLSRMGYVMDFRLLPWKRCLQMIEAGQRRRRLSRVCSQRAEPRIGQGVFSGAARIQDNERV